MGDDQESSSNQRHFEWQFPAAVATDYSRFSYVVVGVCSSDRRGSDG